jgi:hypothetical protein
VALSQGKTDYDKDYLKNKNHEAKIRTSKKANDPW